MMKCTLKHYARFSAEKRIGNNLLEPQTWDALRLQPIVGDDPFALSPSRQEWQAKAEKDAALNQRADSLATLIRTGGFTVVYSFGVGTALLEYLLKRRLGQVAFKCSDYAVRTVEVLKKYFPEADVRCFDLVRSSFEVEDKDCLCLLHRVDTELSDSQWHLIFGRMAKAGFRRVLFIPSRTIGLADICKETVKAWLQPWVKNMAFAGYVRTKDSLFELWRDHYRFYSSVEVGDLTGFLLKIKEEPDL